MSATLSPEEAQSISVADTLERLGVDTRGLSGKEAVRRLADFGPNALEEKRVHPFVKFLAHFWGPIPWMIEAAAVLSAFERDWADFGIIAVMLLFNGAIGFWQEHKADNAIALLKQQLALKALALRDGAWKVVEARELVPGDCVRVRLGEIIPADLKLITGDYLDVDQSALTGESMPVEKKAGDVAYSGSIVGRGEMDGVVVSTGMDTFFGRTARLVQESHVVSHYQRAVLRVGHFLIMLTLALVALILMVALFRHTPLLEAGRFALILTVAAIPVAMPAVLSVTMAVGAVKLARYRAIVTRLVAIEEMAGIDVLCSDKTGTLTQNKLVVEDPIVFSGPSAEETIRVAALASRRENPDPIDRAILEKLAALGQEATGTVEDFEPFDPVTKRTEADVVDGERHFKAGKGAPQVMLDLCGTTGAARDKVQQAVNDLAERGYRTLGVARTDDQGQWTFLGLLPLQDPPREDSAKTLKTAKEMGMAIKMVTGDHHAIARELAGQLGLGKNILTADKLEGLDSHAYEEQVEDADGFAEVFPEHKYRIVQALQRRGHIVGMTGDGVNDAPALKEADAGIAVSGATDAARSAADLVLTAPGLSVIVLAIEEARKIFQRMTAYATYRIAETIRVLLFMTLAILIFDSYPVTAVMIIILALLNDLPIMMIAYDNAKATPKPAGWDMHKVLTLAIVLGVAGVFASFGMYWIGKVYLKLDLPTVQTLMFLKLTVAGHMTIYLTRTGEHPFWHRPFPSLALLGTSELTQIVATLFAVYGWFMEPIGWSLALFVWGYALVELVLSNELKTRAFRLATHGRGAEKRHLERSNLRLHP